MHAPDQLREGAAPQLRIREASVDRPMTQEGLHDVDVARMVLNHLASMADLERVLVSYAQGRGAAYEPGVMNGRRGALGGGHPTNLGS